MGFVEIKVPVKGCSFDTKHAFTSELTEVNGDIPVLDFQGQEDIDMWLLAFIVHFAGMDNRVSFKNVSESFQANYAPSISKILGVDFNDLIN